jgi:hypothetical protein
LRINRVVVGAQQNRQQPVAQGARLVAGRPDHRLQVQGDPTRSPRRRRFPPSRPSPSTQSTTLFSFQWMDDRSAIPRYIVVGGQRREQQHSSHAARIDRST